MKRFILSIRRFIIVGPEALSRTTYRASPERHESHETGLLFTGCVSTSVRCALIFPTFP
jgi:hypothetical protein